MRVKILGLLFLALAIWLAGGCGGGGGGGGEEEIPAALQGYWGVVGFAANGNPVGALLMEVKDNGDIVLPDLENQSARGIMRTAQEQQPGTKIGSVDAEGNFEIQFDNVQITGKLNTNDQGSGTWTSPEEGQGTVQCWRAAYGQSRVYNIIIRNQQGEQIGTGTINVQAGGLATGTVVVNGSTGELGAVVTGNGTIAGMIDDQVFFTGQLTSTSGNGTWRSKDGQQGTWVVGSTSQPLPNALQGFWAFIPFDGDNDPLGILPVEVLANGDIVVADVEGNQVSPGLVRPAQNPGDKIGVVEADGDFTLSGPNFSASGRLKTDDTGSGTFTYEQLSGTFKCWRANWRYARQMEIRVRDQNGNQFANGTVNIGTDGIAYGTIAAGDNTVELRGVVTGNGTLAAVVEIGDNEWVFIRGTLTAGGASGTWRTSESNPPYGKTGTWTATNK